MAQWIRLLLPVWGTQAGCLAWEEPQASGQLRPCAQLPRLPALEPALPAREATAGAKPAPHSAEEPRSPQPEEPRSPQPEEPRSPQPEEARTHAATKTQHREVNTQEADFDTRRCIKSSTHQSDVTLPNCVPIKLR